VGDHTDWQKSRHPLFQQQSPGVALELLEIPPADYRAKIFSMAAINTLPDTVCFANDTVLLRRARRPVDGRGALCAGYGGQPSSPQRPRCPSRADGRRRVGGASTPARTGRGAPSSRRRRSPVCARLLDHVRRLARTAIDAARRQLLRRTRPARTTSQVLGVAADLVRSRSELVAENAFLRHQLIVLARSTKRPRLSRTDRPLLILLASRVRSWRQALLIV
jgi:hypothetical protein